MKVLLPGKLDWRKAWWQIKLDDVVLKSIRLTNLKKTMQDERSWVLEFVSKVETKLLASDSRFQTCRVIAGKKLPYAYEVAQYTNDEPTNPKKTSYQTDVLVLDQIDDACWVPRIVIETKLGSLSTHDALTYSAKAETHKNVHPYLRYGILLGDWRKQPIPFRLIRHGANFDFMISWARQMPRPKEMGEFIELLGIEIETSRTLQELLSGNRARSRMTVSKIHRAVHFTKS